MGQSLFDYCAEAGRQELLAQWHPTKNGPLTPREVSSCSNRRVWWRCPAGHAYRAAVGRRTVQGTGCPYCAGRKVLPGFNDLATADPQVAGQWHPTLNGTLTPDMVTPGSRKKVWWLCLEGHEWKAMIFPRTGSKRAGCPVCAGRTNPRRRGRYHQLPTEPVQTTAEAVF